MRVRVRISDISHCTLYSSTALYGCTVTLYVYPAVPRLPQSQTSHNNTHFAVPEYLCAAKRGAEVLSVRRHLASVAFDRTCRDLPTSAKVCFDRNSGRDLQRVVVCRRRIEACHQGSGARAAHSGISKAITTYVCGLTAAYHAHEHVRRVLNGRASAAWCRCGLRRAETPRRTPVTLLAAAAVGVCKFGTKKSLTKAKDIAVESASRCDLHLAVCLCYRRPQVRAA